MIEKEPAGIAQSVYRLATGWTVRGSNPGGGGGVFTQPSKTPSLLHKGYNPEDGLVGPKHVELSNILRINIRP